jgi:hypothetical protein
MLVRCFCLYSPHLKNILGGKGVVLGLHVKEFGPKSRENVKVTKQVIHIEARKNAMAAVIMVERFIFNRFRYMQGFDQIKFYNRLRAGPFKTCKGVEVFLFTEISKSLLVNSVTFLLPQRFRMARVLSEDLL